MSHLNKEVTFQKSDKGNFFVLVNKSDYIGYIEDIMKDVNKVKKVFLKKGIINFAVNHEKHINKELRSISKNGSLWMLEQQYKWYRLWEAIGILYGLCKVHKAVGDVYPPFRQSFCFVEGIVNQNDNFVIGSLDVDSLFTNILLEETINICCETLFKEKYNYEGYSKSEIKTLLSVASKGSYIFFNEILHKQKDRVAMGLHLGPTLANVFLSHSAKMACLALLKIRVF